MIVDNLSSSNKSFIYTWWEEKNRCKSFLEFLWLKIFFNYCLSMFKFGHALKIMHITLNANLQVKISYMIWFIRHRLYNFFLNKVRKRAHKIDSLFGFDILTSQRSCWRGTTLNMFSKRPLTYWSICRIFL